MYRIILKKRNGCEIATYRSDMRISDLFKDINVMSVSIANEKRVDEFYDALQSFMSKLPVNEFDDGCCYLLAEFDDIENIKHNPCVRRVEFGKMLGEYVILRVIGSNKYGDDTSWGFAVKTRDGAHDKTED